MINTSRKLITMDEFTIQETRKFPQATGELSALLRDIGLACKLINKQVAKAGLVEGILGKQGSTNIQGEEQMKLDVYADETLIPDIFQANMPGRNSLSMSCEVAELRLENIRYQGYTTAYWSVLHTRPYAFQ